MSQVASIDITDDSVDVSSGEGIVGDLETNSPSRKKAKTLLLQIGKKNRKLRSPAWTLYDEIESPVDGKKRAKCKQCGVVYICDSSHGTGNMLNHMKNCPKNQQRDTMQMLLSQSKGNILSRSPKFDNEVFRNLVIEAMIKHNLSFNFVEYEGIRKIFEYVSPNLKLPSRNTAKALTLKMFKNEKQKLQDLLNSIQGKVCLTSDLWSSVTNEGYLTLTCHFVDNEWRLQKRILNFCHMPPPHTGAALFDTINSMLGDWGIEKKLFSITLDNASNNDLFVHVLQNQLNFKGVLLLEGKLFHVHCCAHILNLIVQDGLKEIDDSMIKIRECIKYIKASEGRKNKFLEFVTQVEIMDNRRGLRLDVPTRWNSTYLMLDSALFYRRAFLNLELTNSNFKFCPSSEEWNRIEKISKFLGCFYEVTTLFSRTKYPTSNIFFPKVFIIQDNIKAAVEGSDSFLRKMGTLMSLKFEKYWSEYNLVLAIAVILDPRYKIQFVEWAYTKLHGKDSCEMERVRDTLNSLFDAYMKEFSHPINTNTTMTETSTQMEARENIFEDFDMCYNYSSSSKKSELDKYLDEEKLDIKQELDVLNWWKIEQLRFPILSHLARDVLAIPISTVASESAFSIGGRVLDQFRSSLKPDVVQALLCTRDWLFGKGVSDDTIHLEELTEDVIALSVEQAKSGQCSNTFSVDD